MSAGAALIVGLGAATAPTADGAGSSACTAEGTRSAVSAFVIAYNQGDYEALDSLFASPPDFEWYSSNRPGTRLGAKAKRRGTLIAYFRARHRAGERLGLVAFQFNDNSSGHGNFGFVLRRRLPGFRNGEWFRTDAKGATVCNGGSAQMIVISIGGPADS